MNNLGEKILMTIGKTGISRTKDLYVMDEFKHYSKSEIINSVTQLENDGYINRTIVKLGGKGARNYKAFSLDEKGEILYKSETGNQAHVSEMSFLKEVHGTLELGYFFKEIYEHLNIKRNGNLYSIQTDDGEYPLILDIDLGDELLDLIKEAKEMNNTIYYISGSSIKIFGMMDKLHRNGMSDVNVKSTYLEAVLTNSEPKLPQALLGIWNSINH